MEEVLKNASFVTDLFAAHSMDELKSTDGTDTDTEEGDAAEDAEEAKDAKEGGACKGCCTGVPANSEERVLLQWFRESHAFAKDAITIEAPDNEPFEWVDMPVDDSVPVVMMTRKRMQEIGLVLQNDTLPTREDPARLFWIQAKPVGFKGNFGLWDPIGAQWKLFPGRTVVPIEQRIAPCGIGLAGADEFTDADYGDSEAELYTGTALEAALAHVRTQVRQLPPGTRVPVASGWGESTHTPEGYYTPHLRHVAIDRSIPEAGGKKYVYRFPRGARVAPVPGQYTWNSTNSCLVYRKRGVGGALLPEAQDADRAEFSEQSRDKAMVRA